MEGKSWREITDDDEAESAKINAELTEEQKNAIYANKIITKINKNKMENKSGKLTAGEENKGGEVKSESILKATGVFIVDYADVDKYGSTYIVAKSEFSGAERNFYQAEKGIVVAKLEKGSRIRVEDFVIKEILKAEDNEQQKNIKEAIQQREERNTTNKTEKEAEKTKDTGSKQDAKEVAKEVAKTTGTTRTTTSGTTTTIKGVITAVIEKITKNGKDMYTVTVNGMPISAFIKKPVWVEVGRLVEINYSESGQYKNIETITSAEGRHSNGKKRNSNKKQARRDNTKRDK